MSEVPRYKLEDFEFLPAEPELKLSPQWVDLYKANGSNGNGTEPPLGGVNKASSDSSVIKRAALYVATMDPAISGKGGHRQTFKVACRVVLGFGLTESEAMGVMADYNRRCQPEWTAKDLLHKVQDASKQPGPRNYLRDKQPEQWSDTKVPDYKNPDEPPPHTDDEIDQLEREAIQSEPKTERESEPYIEFAPSFLAIEDPPIQYLINELLPEAIIALAHGEPRTRKSWALLEIAIALATGTPAFEVDRFTAANPVPVLYSSQEDSARDVRIRAKAILTGRGITSYPKTLAFSIHKGINLESFEWNEDLLRDVAQHGFRFVVFDPIRRYAPNVDKGPAEVRAITGFLRRLCIETGATVGAVHHDVKPTADNRDSRRRGHKASGGDWFAAAECPLAFEQAGDSGSLVIPEDYKFSVDPKPFTFRLDTDDPRAPTRARLIGETSSAEDAKFLAMQQKIVSYLSEHLAGASGNAISRVCRMRREDVTTVLNRLLDSGQVDCVGTGGKGRKQTWFLRKNDD